MPLGKNKRFSMKVTAVCLSVMLTGGFVVFGLLPRWLASADGQVQFEDPMLAAAVREEMGLGAQEPVLEEEFKLLTELDCADKGIQSLSGLEYASSLQLLNLAGNRLDEEDLKVLTALPRLSRLDISGNGLEGISPLKEISGLEVLDISSNRLYSLDVLEDFPALKKVYAQENYFERESIPASLENGQSPILVLYPQNTRASADAVSFASKELEDAVREELGISGTEALTKSQLANLTELSCPDLSIDDLSGLEYAVNLERLYVSRNQLESVSPLKGLTKLRVLDVRENYLSSSALGEIQTLEQKGTTVFSSPQREIVTDKTAVEISDPAVKKAVCEELGISSDGTVTRQQMSRLIALEVPNGAKSLVGLEYAVNLERFSAREGKISDLSPLSGLSSLISLDLTGQEISSMAPLSSLTGLRVLLMSDNQISSLAPLEALTSLEAVVIDHNMLNVSEGSVDYQLIQTWLNAGKNVRYLPQEGGWLEPADGSHTVLNREEGQISGIPIGTAVSSVSEIVKTEDIGNYRVEVLSADGVQVTSGNIGTGMTIRLVNQSNGSVAESVQTVVYGDITGDGIVDISDLVTVRLYLFDREELAGPYFEAGNVTAQTGISQDDIIDISDLVSIRLYLFGRQDIPQY